MDKLYLISERNIEKAKTYNNSTIILFKQTYKTNPESPFKTITPAQIAKQIIEASNKKFGTNSTEKAKEICKKTEEDFDIYLLYSDTIHHNLEKKTTLIIENNNELNSIDTNKIFLQPPWPIIIENLRRGYPKHRIFTIDKEDEELFQLNYYYKHIR